MSVELIISLITLGLYLVIIVCSGIAITKLVDKITQELENTESNKKVHK